MTLPSLARRSFVRTKAPPLPGLTCWNSRTLKIVPSTSMWLPFLSWLVLIMAAEVSVSAAAATNRRPGGVQTGPFGRHAPPGRSCPRSSALSESVAYVRYLASASAYITSRRLPKALGELLGALEQLLRDLDVEL